MKKNDEYSIGPMCGGSGGGTFNDAAGSQRPADLKAEKKPEQTNKSTERLYFGGGPGKAF